MTNDDRLVRISPYPLGAFSGELGACHVSSAAVLKSSRFHEAAELEVDSQDYR